ncbi:condensation domain-containing protein, partial [Streptomyces sp. NPDC050211]|uniref:condensation domain-containing protein n=1 Tax=Streptomyces sp. NPDC050211 TaxID=3154932 RepID=UPI003427F377
MTADHASPPPPEATTTVVVDLGRPPYDVPALELRGPLDPARLTAALDHLAVHGPGARAWRHRIDELGPGHHALRLAPDDTGAPADAFPYGRLADLLTHPLPGGQPARSLAATPLQRELLADCDAHPGRHVQQLTVLWHGPLDLERVRAAWQSVTDSESVLRAAFDDGPEPLIVLHEHLDATVLWLPDGAVRWPDLLAHDRMRGIDPRLPGPLRVTVFGGGPERGRPVPSRMLLTYHHALLDDFSARLLLREFYRAYLAGGRLPGGERRPDLRDYGRWLARQDTGPARDLWSHTQLPPTAATWPVPPTTGTDHPAPTKPPATGTDRSLSVQPPTGTDRPASVVPPVAGVDRPASVAPLAAGADRPASVAPPAAGADQPLSVAPLAAGADRPASVQPPTGTDRPASVQPPTGTDRSASVEPPAVVARARLRLTAAQTERLGTWAAHWGSTESSVLQAVWALLLYRARGAASAVRVRFDVTASGRGISFEGAQRLPAALRTALPLSIEVDPRTTVATLLAELRDRALDMSAYEWISPGQARTWATPQPQPAPAGEDGTLLVFESRPHDPDDLADALAAQGIRVEEPDALGARTAFPLTLVAHHDGDGRLVLTAFYDRARLEDAAGVLTHSALLLGELPYVAGDSTTVADILDLLSAVADAAEALSPSHDQDTTVARDPVGGVPATEAEPLLVPLRPAQAAGAGTVCLLQTHGTPRSRYDRLARAYRGPEEIVLLRSGPGGAHARHTALRPWADAGQLLVLGGFSGGGSVAYEIARRIAAGGRRPPLVVLTAAAADADGHARMLHA